MHKFKVRQNENGVYEIYIDDRKVMLRGCDIRLRRDEIPTVKCEFFSSDDVDIQGILELSDKDLLRMIKVKLDDKEFYRDLLWTIGEPDGI